ncbi:MAG: prepilin-type N-terminal cleavage/methylation domain-containing protein [Lachnospiraceae bacterium]|nr:prepilin-type N-terminal cleavage/methylation domain-containing protein [Lachnospiraceae bacterium]
MRKNQKGFTLVELIIAIAILAIVTLAVCGFIVVGSRSYTSANTDIMLQQEAQLALNQISDVIIDTTDSISYGNGTELVLKDSEFSSEPDEKILVVVNKKGSNNDNDSYRFEWSKDTQTIYFNTSDTVIDDTNPEPVFNDTNRAILAQHVKELHIDISQFEENRVVMISMTFQNGNKEYTTSNNVTVRNRIALNKIDIEPMKKANEFTITTVRDIVLEPGDSFNLADKTQVDTNSDDQAVKWELVDTGTTTSSVSADGQLTIGTNETRKSFLVRVSRVNEEYANQNDKVAKTVQVNVKRVNSVDLSCASTTIKAGSTVTVNGSAVGYMLGRSCEAHSCLTDDETKDHDLAATRWRIVRGPAEIVTSDTGEAEVKIKSTAKKGEEIEIEATSDLSLRKSYGAVTGTLILRVTEGDNGAKFIGSELKFGTDNDPGIFDYMRTSLKTDHSRYVFCVRVREAGTVGCQNDYVMVYFTEGANERFSPDAFGLDHRKSYEIYFQVLDPRPKGSRTEASKEEIKTEYLNKCDDNGKYIGTMFDADEYYYAVLNQPSVAVKINGVTYPNDEKESYEHFSFLSTPNNNPLGGMIEIADAGAINILREAVLNNIRFTVYKEDENGRWKRVYGYAHDTEEYADNRNGTTRIGALPISPDRDGNYNDKGNNTGQNRFGKIVFQPGSNPTVTNLTNSNAQEMQEACGMYHIVPGFVYANNPDIRAGAYTGDNVIYKNVPGDYDTYYYKQWDCVINLRIDMGLNMQLPNVNGEERWTNFPVPSDRAFPFDLRSDTKQEIIYNFTSYSKDGQWRGTIDNATVMCEYLGQDKYRITLSSMEINGRQIITHIYGKYEASMGQLEWTRVGLEETKIENIQTNLEFTKDNKQYETYFPTPSDADFPIGAFDNNSTLNNWQLISFSKDGSSDALIEKCIVKCSKSGSAYTIEIIREILTNNPRKKIVYNYGTFSWDGAKWNRTKAGSNTGVDTAIWGTRIGFTYNGSQCMLEAPLPSESGFPNISGSYSESVTEYFFATDTYGENAQNSWGGIKKEYTYDASTDTYTLKLVNGYTSGVEYGTWTCTSNGTQWTKQ